MFADPFVVSLSAPTALTLSTGVNFVCSERAADHSTYRYVDADKNEYIYKVAHQYGRTRNRFTMRVDVSGVIPSVMVPSENASFSQACYVVFDVPVIGPIEATTTVANIARNMCNAIGSQMLSVGGDGNFLNRVVRAGET